MLRFSSRRRRLSRFKTRPKSYLHNLEYWNSSLGLGSGCFFGGVVAFGQAGWTRGKWFRCVVTGVQDWVFSTFSPLGFSLFVRLILLFQKCLERMSSSGNHHSLQTFYSFLSRHTFSLSRRPCCRIKAFQLPQGRQVSVVRWCHRH